MKTKKLTKKLLFSLATIGVIAAPISFAVSCGSASNHDAKGNDTTELLSPEGSGFLPASTQKDVKVFDSVTNQEVSVRDLFLKSFNYAYDNVASGIVDPYEAVWSIMHPEWLDLMGSYGGTNSFSASVDTSEHFSTETTYYSNGTKDGKDVAQFKTSGYGRWAGEITEVNFIGKSTGEYLYAYMTPPKTLANLDVKLYDALNHFAFKKGVIKQIVDFVNNAPVFGDGRDEAITRLKGKLIDPTQLKLTDEDLDDEGNIYISFQDITNEMIAIPNRPRITDPSKINYSIVPDRKKEIPFVKDWSKYVSVKSQWEVSEGNTWFASTGQNGTLHPKENYQPTIIYKSY